MAVRAGRAGDFYFWQDNGKQCKQTTTTSVLPTSSWVVFLSLKALTPTLCLIFSPTNFNSNGRHSPNQQACLGALRCLEKRVTRRDVLEYGLQEQQKNKIKVTCVDFDPKEPGFSSCFFKPYPTDRLTPPGDNLFPAGEFPEHGEADEEISSLIWSGNARILTNNAERYIIDHRNGSPEDGDTVGAGPGWDYQW